MTTWVAGAHGSAYDVTNLPYGVFSRPGEEPRVGARIGAYVLDLAPLSASHLRADAHVFESPALNDFMALGHPVWQSVRSWLSTLLNDHAAQPEVAPFLVPLADVTMHLPFEVADYVDFYCSLEHATNVGRIFRPDAEPLLPNWRHLPVGYHGRAGTIVPSGTDIVRPTGQRKPKDADSPALGPSARLDIEAELGFVVGTGSTLGTPVTAEDFAEHVFGVVLVNDWSARDIQAWEYVPLGPFLGKSFATSIAAWVTPLDALGKAKVPLPGQDPAPLPYLRVEGDAGYDIDVEVSCNGTVVSRPPYRSMYWSAQQMLAHLTVNGASLRTGDLFASGTISGTRRDQRGSLLELSWGGREPVALDDGSSRSFLEDGDEVVLTASAPGPEGGRIGLGEVAGRILPAVT
ncbi:MAG TPA: fumarylacetoacetase [Nocardioidaceae bacterium]|nr:fumarylacetoacetase [Nocardioidaceae bacterium]